MPSLTKQNLLCLAVALFICPVALAQSGQSESMPDAQSSAPKIKPLEGGIDETWTPSDRVPLAEWKNAIAPRLQHGVKWSDNMLPQLNTEIFWLPIPSWLAGQWQTENASFISASGGRVGESAAYLSRHIDSFGCQRDGSGAIWHLMRFPTVSSTQSGDNISYFIDFTMSGSAKNLFHINFAVDDVEVIISKSDKTVQTVRRRHDTTSWIKIGPIVSVDDLMIIDGSASENGTIRSQPKLIAPFQKVDRFSDGYDVKASLNHFLVNNGKADLVPIETHKK